ncbi:hypothetical protein DSO57_1016819 [Entomophthora muscae]|uniref:Uncharacterized protein n=1 Tax=Entomophthora muscae TaxID=34485 RepID=A0ACC2UE30_9FUNG|nr:hypothetical protein DSO57_1016819 [Entomophthora muscae]
MGGIRWRELAEGQGNSDETVERFRVTSKADLKEDPLGITTVGNCAINAISIWPSNNDKCKDLTVFAFDFGNSLLSVNGSGPISTHSGIPYFPLSNPGMTSSQRDPLSHYVSLMSDHCPLSTI